MKADEEFARKLQADLDKEYTENLTAARERINRRVEQVSPLSSSSNLGANNNTASASSRRRLNDHSDSLQNAYRILQRSTDNLRSNNIRSAIYNLPTIHPSIQQDVLNLMARNISSNELSSNSINPATMPVSLTQMTQSSGNNYLLGDQGRRNRFEPNEVNQNRRIQTNHNFNNFGISVNRRPNLEGFFNSRSQNNLFSMTHNNDPNSYEVFF